MVTAARPCVTLPRRMSDRGAATATAALRTSPRAAPPPPPPAGAFGAPLLSFATRLFRAPSTARAERASASGSSAPAAEPRHLFFLVHGLGGRPEDLASLREALLSRSGGAAAVHLARANYGSRGASTHDGIEAGAARLVDELRSVVAARPSLTHLSFVGNSLGGLYCRYAAALALDVDESGRGSPTVAGLRPVTFLTTATPHLGVGAFGYLGLVPSWLQAGLGSRAMGRTIAELLLQDAPTPGGVPLLVRMATPDGAAGSAPPAGQLPFVRALAAFRRRIAYANAANDFLVAYETAAILPPLPADVARSLGPLPLPAMGGAPRVLHTRDRPATSAPVEPLIDPRLASSSPPPRDRLALQRRMASGLGTLAWTETAVLFPGALPMAHNKIVALRRDPLMTWLYRDGAAVVLHTADALLAEAAEEERAHAAQDAANVS